MIHPHDAIDIAVEATLKDTNRPVTDWRPLAAWVRRKLADSTDPNIGARICPGGCVTQRIKESDSPLDHARSFELDGTPARANENHECTHQPYATDDMAIVTLQDVIDELSGPVDIQPFVSTGFLEEDERGRIVTYLTNDVGHRIADSAKPEDQAVFYAAGWTDGDLRLGFHASDEEQ